MKITFTPTSKHYTTQNTGQLDEYDKLLEMEGDPETQPNSCSHKNAIIDRSIADWFPWNHIDLEQMQGLTDENIFAPTFSLP